MFFKNLFLLILISSTTHLLYAQNGTSRVTLTVDMSAETIAEEGVFVVGNFFNGTPELLDDNGDGTWSYPLTFTTGDSLFYKFMNGTVEEEVTEGACLTADGQQRLLVVPDEETTIVETCFNHCVTCEALTTSTSEVLLADWQFQLSPNPMQTHTVASWKMEEVRIHHIQLLDLSGRTLRTYNKLDSSNLTIEKGALSTGIYLLKIRDEEGRVATQKLIVQ